MFRSRGIHIVNRVRYFSKQTLSDLEKRMTDLENRVKQKEDDMDTLAGVSGALFLGLMYLAGTTKR